MSDERAELKSPAEKDGVRFFFAMFVDMHGKPCAKLIPVEAIDVLTGGARASRGSRPGRWAEPRRSGHDRRPGPGLVCSRRGTGAGRAAVRHPRRGPALALHPPADPKNSWTRSATAAGPTTSAARPSTSSSGDGRGGVELADPLDTAEAPCYDAKGLTRMFLICPRCRRT